MALAMIIDNAKRQIEKTKERRFVTFADKRRVLVHCIAVALLISFVASNPLSRYAIIFASVFFEVLTFLSPTLHRRVDSQPWTIYTVLVCVQLLAIIFLDWSLSSSPVMFPGVIPPPKGLYVGLSGDPRIIVGRNGTVEMQYSLEAGSIITAGANSILHGGKPYITGDDISVIIVARDEDEFITKTIRFTFESSPKNVLREIIVVDDASLNHVASIIDKELEPSIRRFVRVLRFDTREGLIRARIAGADLAEASNIFFLDGHCRPTPGWLPPLMKHLKANYRRLACPIIHDIHRQTWGNVGTHGVKMMFDWTFEFDWYDDLTDEIPLSAGGIFAMTKKWWEESGKYDPGMLEWGGENLEQSFRVWLCGGEIYVVRDSHVGHIFNRPPKPNPNNQLVEQVQKNQKRGALVWLDEYYELFERFHSVVKTLDEGPNLDLRHAMRRRLKCKPFQWYVNKFRTAFEMKGLLVNNFHHIRHIGSRWCLALNSSNGVVLEPCQDDNDRQRWSIVAGNRMISHKGGFKKQQCLTKKKIGSYFTSQYRLAVLQCSWVELLRAEETEQFWQFDSVNTHRLFTYPTTKFKSLTGTDDFYIDQRKAKDAGSLCLSFPHKYSEIINLDVSERNVRVEHCSNSSNVEEWGDPQAWEWIS